MTRSPYLLGCLLGWFSCACSPGSAKQSAGAGAVTADGGAAGSGASAGVAAGGGGAAAGAGTSGTSSAGASGVAAGGASGAAGGGVAGAAGSGAVSYKINPPNACQNQYYYANCTSGDASTVCGGVCQPRNACENAPSKDGKVGFACSRYMLWSPEMSAAASDDAAANAWPAPQGSPFMYAVAGHDTNTGGVDQGMVGSQPCCECYQLVFDKPFNEYDTQTPPPKPMVVQVFNIGATTDSFDIYMGAGGLGAFNACYGTDPAGSYLYDAYPSDGQPNGGGVKFLRYTECQDASAFGEATQASVTSAACQDKIAGFCNQANASRSAELTSTTRDSCISGNQFTSLYHQNWSVYARRVSCPDNLTRVTGCKLAPEAGLPAVDANVTTAAQAASAGFLSGYHTTTMQDCCKPACSWIEKVGGSEANKNVSAPWTNIYACDANDQPFTEP